MNATPEPHGPAAPDVEEYDYEGDGFSDTQLPLRPRRPFLTRWTAGLMALVLGAVGFYVGVRVEKDKIPSTSGAGSAFARAFSGATGASGTAGTAGTTGTTGARGSTSSRTGSLASRFGGGAGGFFGGAGGNDTVGSVASVDGSTIYIKETSGNTVKVKLSGQTTITKSESVAKSKVYPGDEVVIAGVKGSGGTVTATSVTDSGAGAGSSASSSSGSGGSASSAISSLFGS